MRRWCAIAGLLGVLSLVGAGVAAADVTNTDGTWFIGRGDVISHVGKAALVPTATAEWYWTGTSTTTCTYADGTKKLLQISQPGWIDYVPLPRYAPGSGLITGYFAGFAQDVSGIQGPSTWWVTYLLELGCGPGSTAAVADQTPYVQSYRQTLFFDGVRVWGDEPLPWGDLFTPLPVSG